MQSQKHGVWLLLLTVVLCGKGCMHGGAGQRSPQSMADLAIEAEAGVKRVHICRDISLNAMRTAVAATEDAGEALLAALDAGDPDAIAAARNDLRSLVENLDAASSRAVRLLELEDEAAMLSLDVEDTVRRAISLAQEAEAAGVFDEALERLRRLNVVVRKSEKIAEVLKNRWLVVSSPAGADMATPAAP